MIALAPATPGIHAEPGDLHATLSGDRLLVPQDVLQALSQQRLRSAEDLYSYLSSFPTTCAYLLHWSISDCVKAAGQLGATLKAGGQDVSTPYFERGMGARDPDLLDP